MRRLAVIVPLAVALFLSTAKVWAQDSEPPSNYEHLKNAEWLIGTWESKGVVPEGAPNAGKEYVFQVRQYWILNKNAIDVGLAYTVDGKTTSSKVILAWNPSQNQIVSSGFGSEGGFGTGVLQIEPRRMTLKDDGFREDGSTVSYRVELTLKDKDTILRKVTDRKEGKKKLPDIVDTLRRVKRGSGKRRPAKAELSPNYDEYKILERFIGRWTCKGGIDDQSAEGSFIARWASPKKHCIVWSGDFGEPGKPESLVITNGVMTWDAAEKRVKELASTSAGMTALAVFKVQDNKLIGERSGVEADGTKWTMKLEFTLGKDKWVSEPSEKVGQDGKVIERYTAWEFLRRKR